MAESNRRTRGRVLKWALVFLAVVVLFFLAIFLNNNHSIEDASKIRSAIDIDYDDQKINWNRYPTYDIELSESLVITEAGTYHLTGSLANGNITIDAKNTVVKLILDNISISNTNGPAIICNDGLDLVIELVGKNTLMDGANYSSEYDSDVTGVIYANADLTFQGEGSLNITANYFDGIIGKDDLKFMSGNYAISAKDDAIRGRDSVYILNGNFDLITGADGIKVTNETDPGRGFVLIENGTFHIVASAKGIKATSSLMIYNGGFIINSFDDAIHSNNYVGIVGGDINIVSGDDGIHADRELIIDDGQISVEKAYEGLESQAVLINGGDISLSTSDDGINAGGGADNSSLNRKSGGPFKTDENCAININGGRIYINSGGDGVDSNGYLYFNGGETIVDGPTDNGNGALDSGFDIVMNGGEVLAVGASGMAVGLGNNSSIYNASIYLDSTFSAGTEISIKKQTGESVVSHTSAKSFSHISVGSPLFKFGETYDIYLDNSFFQSFTIYNNSTVIGDNRFKFEHR